MRRRFFILAALVALPVIAFVVAPGARADTSSPAATPGSNLAGLTADGYATGIQFVPYARGVVPAGNLATGDFFQTSVPYAGVSSQTGPASTAIGTPVYPGPVAIALPGALQTEGFPASLANYTADPVKAEAAYPTEPGEGASASYTPPSGSTTGAGTATATATIGSSTASAATSDTPLAGGAVVVGSSTAQSSTTIGASSVSDTASSYVSKISILKGLVDISSITSHAATSTNGTTGTENSTLQVGSVTVAGEVAYIGPDGLHLGGRVNNLVSINTFNAALTALQQAGLSVSTIAPTSSVQGAAASVESGTVQIKFLDPNIPNPGGEVPVNLIGADIDLGLTDADAQATLLPAIASVSSNSVPAAPIVSVTSPPVTTSPVTAVTSTGGGIETITRTNSTSSGGVSTSPGTSTGGSSNRGEGQVVAQPATLIGMPTRMAWVVIALILSIVASGPLLGYANWQLLRGRRS